VPIDAIAGEPQFLDHLAPVWKALPPAVRGRFLVAFEMAEQAQRLEIDAILKQFTVGTEAGSKGEPRGPKCLVASYGDVKKARRLGYGDFARFEHGIGQAYSNTHPSYAGGRDASDHSLFLMPNEYSANLWWTAYPSARVEVVGSPRLDSLPQREGEPGRVVAFSLHWRCNVAPETYPAGEFASALPALSRRFTVLGHGHPRGIGDLMPYYQRLGIELVPDFEEICRRADVFVADNSSAMYEFAATGRPVVALNSQNWRRHVHHGLRFWDAVPGEQVDDPADLIDAVERALGDPDWLRAVREHALGIVYPYRSGAAQRAAQRLATWAQVAVAA